MTIMTLFCGLYHEIRRHKEYSLFHLHSPLRKTKVIFRTAKVFETLRGMNQRWKKQPTFLATQRGIQPASIQISGLSNTLGYGVTKNVYLSQNSTTLQYFKTWHVQVGDDCACAIFGKHETYSTFYKKITIYKNQTKLLIGLLKQLPFFFILECLTCSSIILPPLSSWLQYNTPQELVVGRKSTI